MKMVMICEDCGDKPKPNKEKSTENWEVFDTTCSKCGGKVTMKFE